MSDTVRRLDEALEGRYSIVRELGEGGMATVYLARDERHDREVALKVLKPELASAMGAERFLSEIAVTARLRHPNILPLFDSGEAGGLLYFVMPFVEGGSLRDRIDDEGRLPVDEAIRITGEIAEALSHAHERGVVHRDVKPGNVVFDAGHALVGDFGISRAVTATDGDRLTQTGLSLGTPTYMSPEQAAGGGDVGPPSDVYSLACIAYEMLAGEPPFSGDTSAAVIGRHLTEDPPSIRAVRPEVPAGVDRALREGLAKQPGDRPPGAADLADRLREAATAPAIAAEERRRRRARWGRTALLVAAAAGAIVGGRWLMTREAGPRFERLAVLPLANRSPDAGQEYLVAGIHEALINELTQAGITAIARQSVLQFANSDLTIREIAEAVNADAVVQGSVVPVGDSVSISATLFDGRSEESLWSSSFDGDITNILGLYRDVTRSIANEIRASLSPTQVTRLTETPTVNPEAYIAYQRGIFHAQLFTPEDLQTALTYFETALAIDSLYAPAYVGIARVWGFRAQAGMVRPAESAPIRDSLLARALAIDSTLAEARLVLAGTATWGNRNWAEGEAEFGRTLEYATSPRVEAEARIFLSHLLTILGRWTEADAHATRARELDPLNPFIVGLYAVQRGMTRRYDESIATFEEMLTRSRGAGFGMGMLADMYLLTGREDDAVRVRRTLLERNGFPDAVAALDRGLDEGGYRLAFVRAAEALETSERRAPTIEVMALYASAGELDRAMEWVEVALEEGDQNLPYLGVQPLLEPLHDRPRFREIVERLGLSLVTGSLDG